VLFLDEFPEFSKKVLETLRQPLEDRQITISRAKYTATLPCSFMLVAAMNPCPCGYLTDPSRRCTCTEGMVQRYRSRVSGPLLDRIDLQIDVVPVPIKDLSDAPAGESSEEIRKRVIAARQIQENRFKNCPGIHCNAQMTEKMLQQYATPTPEAAEQLRRAMERLQLSARAYSRILKVARTIADLEGAEDVSFTHISEAISYRNLDRGDWAER
ncbi:MAG: ATP-binding protein, partial [Prevotella sp.]|nr:ATP-binding protein [Prevotella sp.]